MAQEVPVTDEQMAREMPTTEEQMAQERSHGGKAAVMQQQEHKPGMGEKLKHTIAHVKEKVTGHSSPPVRHPDKEERHMSPDVPLASTEQHHSPGAAEQLHSPRQDPGEKIIEKLPGSHTNPYSTGHEHNPEPNPSPGFFGKIKNMVTGQKPTQGTATENATTGTAGTTGATQHTQHTDQKGYTQDPVPEGRPDIYDRTKEKFGLGRAGPDRGSEETWPSPAKPQTVGATFKDDQGRPIEGPTQPREEDTKKEGLMTKVMDKLNINNERESKPTTETGHTTS